MPFHRFILLRFLCNKRCSKVIIRVLDENPTHKHMLRRQMTEIGNLTSWPQMTLTSEWVTSGLGRCLDMSQTRIMSIHRLLMRLFSEFCGGKAINGKCQTFCVWPDLWRHRWPRGQIFKLYLKDLVQASLLRVESFRQSFGYGDRCGATPPPPPPSRGQGSDQAQQGAGQQVTTYGALAGRILYVCTLYNDLKELGHSNVYPFM